MGESEQGLAKAEVSKERYNFFKQSSYFKASRGEYGGLIRNGSNITKRNLLSGNRRFLAFPSASNGILLMSVAVVGMKLQRRQGGRAMGEFEQERNFISNAVNNANLTFEPFQLAFSKGSNNVLAVVGASQVGFFVLNNEGKVQKFLESDIKLS